MRGIYISWWPMCLSLGSLFLTSLWTSQITISRTPNGQSKFHANPFAVTCIWPSSNLMSGLIIQLPYPTNKNRTKFTSTIYQAFMKHKRQIPNRILRSHAWESAKKPLALYYALVRSSIMFYFYSRIEVKPNEHTSLSSLWLQAQILGPHRPC